MSNRAIDRANQLLPGMIYAIEPLTPYSCKIEFVGRGTMSDAVSLIEDTLDVDYWNPDWDNSTLEFELLDRPE